MKVGDLVRNKHTVFDGPADERGIIVEVQRAKWSNEAPSKGHWFVRVVWFNNCVVGEYETWMDGDDLEVVNESG